MYGENGTCFGPEDKVPGCHILSCNYISEFTIFVDEFHDDEKGISHLHLCDFHAKEVLEFGDTIKVIRDEKGILGCEIVGKDKGWDGGYTELEILGLPPNIIGILKNNFISSIESLLREDIEFLSEITNLDKKNISTLQDSGEKILKERIRKKLDRENQTFKSRV